MENIQYEYNNSLIEEDENNFNTMIIQHVLARAKFLFSKDNEFF